MFANDGLLSKPPLPVSRWEILLVASRRGGFAIQLNLPGMRSTPVGRDKTNHQRSGTRWIGSVCNNRWAKPTRLEV